MPDSIVARLFREVQQTLFEELKPRMQEIMETAFNEAWNATMLKLAETPNTNESHSVQKLPRRSGNVATRAPWGTTKKVIQGALATNRSGGMTPNDIAEWGVVQGQKVAASSVRTTLQKMSKDGEIIRRGDLYLLKSSDLRNPGGGQSDVAPEIVHAFKGAA